MDILSDEAEMFRGSGTHMSASNGVSLREPSKSNEHADPHEQVDGLLVRVGNGRFVIPLAAVVECLELSLEEDQRSRGSSLVTWRDRLVPFLRLREILATGTEPDTYQKIVIVSAGAERVGLVVDQIIDNQRATVRRMPSLQEDVATFAGATILADGGVALILDVAQLVGQHREERLQAAG